MVKKSPEIKVILGPTSSGKTAYALKECKKCGGEIISFDSRQLFKHMDIGTGKVPINSDIPFSRHDKYWLVDSIKVWGYDLALPNDYFSAYDYSLFAKTKIDELIKSNTPIYLVGGTGFYLDVLLGKITLDSSVPDLQLRAELSNYSHEDLLAKLKVLDIQKFESIDQSNPRRVMRAVESLLSKHKTNKKVDFISPLQNLDIEILGFIATNTTLYNRADLWLEHSWKNGLIDETVRLLENYPDSYGLKGLIYKQVVAFIRGEIPEKEAIEKAKFGIHAYIRRQLTWFKKSSNVRWLQI